MPYCRLFFFRVSDSFIYIFLLFTQICKYSIKNVPLKYPQNIWRHMWIRMSTMKPKLFGIQIWWYVPDFPIDIRIRLAELKIFLLLPDFANSLPCWLSQENCASQQGRKLAKSGSNKKNFNSANLILMSIGKSGTYHQIWIPNDLGFLVLMYIHCVAYLCAGVVLGWKQG